MKTYLISCLLILGLGGMTQSALGQIDRMKKKTRWEDLQPGAPDIPVSTVRVNTQGAQPLLGPSPLTRLKQQAGQSLARHVRIVRDPASALPVFIESLPGPSGRAATRSLAALQAATDSYLDELGELLPLRNPRQELVWKDHRSDDLGHTHVRLQQMFQGLPVFGQEVQVHFQPDGKRLFNGRITPTPRIGSLQPTLDEASATGIALADVMERSGFRELNAWEKKMLNYDQPPIRLVVYPQPDQVAQHRLAYHLEVRPNFIDHYFYFVDAHTGEILNAFNHTCSIAGPISKTVGHLNENTYTLNTFEFQPGAFVMIDVSKDMFRGNPNGTPSIGEGIIVTLDLKNQPVDSIQSSEFITSGNNTWPNEAQSAHINASISYDYFRQIHQRQSINGKGNDVVSFINVTEDDGRGLDNAFWNGFYMFYGNGDFAFDPLMGGLDVGGHELTHGVIQETANLIYQGQPGALNEHFADVFGFLIEGEEDFRIGEDIVRANIFRSGALRNLLEPNNGVGPGENGYQPDNFNERFTGQEDNGGVHINSGIPNRAFALFYQAVGRDKAERVYYRALSTYLTRTSQFIDAREALIQSAQDLGLNANEIGSLESAFNSVGILAPNQGGEETQEDVVFPALDLEVNPGEDFIIVTNTDFANDNNTLYQYNPRSGNFFPISQTINTRPVSITDNGNEGYFVDVDNQIQFLLDLNTTNPAEAVLDTNSIWRNIAVSKDGSKLAAVSVFQDTSIYVIDLDNNDPDGGFKQFKLFNPTTAQGVSTSGVLYADAITWDHSGQFILYDALNRINTSNGAVEFWDAALLQVWDNERNDFASGETIFKLFNLELGESIGNAVFAQNANYVIAFDLELENDTSTVDDNEYFVYAANIEDGEIQQLAENTIFGFPQFSVDDSRLLYSTLNEDQERFEVKGISLGSDKISPQGDPQDFFTDGIWATWYAVGERNLNVKRKPVLTPGSWEIYPNPVDQELALGFSLQQGGRVKVRLLNTLGQVSWESHEHQVAPGRHDWTLDLPGLPAGMYWLQIETPEGMAAKKVLKK